MNGQWHALTDIWTILRNYCLVCETKFGHHIWHSTHVCYQWQNITEDIPWYIWFFCCKFPILLHSESQEWCTPLWIVLLRIGWNILNYIYINAHIHYWYEVGNNKEIHISSQIILPPGMKQLLTGHRGCSNIVYPSENHIYSKSTNTRLPLTNFSFAECTFCNSTKSKQAYTIVLC